ncbi:sigma-70 family RNA polymerase sigma factor [Streptomyces sp. NPDC057552]|uniref:sigma-70 family RNA polymerase sigma factor n=1 Tax=Streptomyces sp. NPDC057552 TaxID=3350537 RepID=UPI0036CC6AE1
MWARGHVVNGTKDVNGVDSTALVVAARNGDRAAGERLAAQYLPLVYNIVGRALNGHPDVDDVVQETMLRALSGLPSLRDPARFRSWLVAIAMNQVRTRWAGLGHRPAPLEETEDPADPAADFVDLTILRLELSGQRRETAEATRWLDDAERDVLSLWWLETTGELTRAELAEALGLSPQHAAVRVQRVKNQLDVGRAVVRALASDPRCPALEDLLGSGDWDGTPTPLWRKRIARHVRVCASCSAGSTGLVPPEGLLSGLALVVPLYETGQHATTVAALASSAPAAAAPAAASASAAPAVAPAVFSAGKAAGLIAGAAAVTTLAVLFWPSAPTPPEARGGGATYSPAPPPPAAAPAEPLPTPSPSTAPPTPSPSATAVRPPSTPAPAPSSALPETAPAAPPPGPDARLVTRVNTLRAENGCPGLRTDPRLTEVAQRHSEDMAAQGYFGHTDSTGRDMGERVTDSGYLWSAVGETIATGPSDPAAVAEQWRRSPGRGDDILNCDFVHVGVGIADSPRGPYWTQVLGTPR